MFVDGVFVLMTGKYIGPEFPGPWAMIFNQLKVDVFKLGPLFILYGILWFVYIYGLQTNQGWTYIFGLLISLATLWYLPFGTLISILTIVILIYGKNKLAL